MAQGLGSIILILLVPVQPLQRFRFAPQQFRRFAQLCRKMTKRRLFLLEIHRLQGGGVAGVTQFLILLGKLRLKALPFFRVQRILFSLFFPLFPRNRFLLLRRLTAAFFLAAHRVVQVAAFPQHLQLTGKFPHLLFCLLVACPSLLQRLLRQGDLVFQALYFGLTLLGKLTGRQIIVGLFTQHILVVADILVAQLAGLLQALPQRFQPMLDGIHLFHGVDHGGNVLFTQRLQRGVQDLLH